MEELVKLRSEGKPSCSGMDGDMKIVILLMIPFNGIDSGVAT